MEKVAIDCRKKSVIAKIFLAASFASALIQPLGGLPFFVHLWGVDSGTGKTVALMLAASVWGTPEMGEYIQTFNSTVVGHERTAAFLNSLPFLIDELQLSKDSHGRSRFDVYQLAQGVGRSRGTKTGGIERTPTWRNTILTTGESPIVGGSAGAGAVNRVIDIECTANNIVIADGMAVSAVIKQNYGFAGREFVAKLSSQKALTMAQEVYNDYFTKLCKSDTTEKQAMAAAMILTADMIAEASVFKTNEPLTIDDISPYLQTKNRYQQVNEAISICAIGWLLTANALRQVKTITAKCLDLSRAILHISFVQSSMKRLQNKVSTQGHYSAG